MENLIMEVVKNTKKSSLYTNFEKKIEKRVKKLEIQIPRNDIKFDLKFDDDYVSPKIRHYVNIYIKN